MDALEPNIYLRACSGSRILLCKAPSPGGRFVPEHVGPGGVRFFPIHFGVIWDFKMEQGYFFSLGEFFNYA